MLVGRYEDGGKVRPVMHRASMVEIIVPYGDPRAPFHKKCAFDIVDYGLGASCSSLDLGCDCLGHIHYFDGMLVNKNGALSRCLRDACTSDHLVVVFFSLFFVCLSAYVDIGLSACL
jgi:Cu2+-containing amine oxidase